MSSCKSILFSVLFIFSFDASFGQIVWQEDFSANPCQSGCPANNYTSAKGTWTVANGGAEGAKANVWYVSCAENGNAGGACGTQCSSASGNNSLHIANVSGSVAASFFCPNGDCGANYDAGSGSGVTLTNTRAISPVINLTGKSNLTLTFLYLKGGKGSDNFTVDYSSDGGITWTQLSDPAKTNNSGCPKVITGLIGDLDKGHWSQISPISLPTSADNNANVKIAFHWVNDDDGQGTDPSAAVDNIVINMTTSTPKVDASFTVTSRKICAGQCLTFTNTSTATGTSIAIWDWTFTGATTVNGSTNNNVQGKGPHTVCYGVDGNYNVELYVSDATSVYSSRLTETSHINVDPGNCVNPKAVFTVSPSGALCENDCVTFTDNSSGGTTPFKEWKWTFPGGNPSTYTGNSDATKNPPAICYGSSGTYTAKLRVTDAANKADSTTSSITVNNCVVPPKAVFTISDKNPCKDSCVTFIDKSTFTGDPTKRLWIWTFRGSDGVTTSFTGQNPPPMCYSANGTDTIELYVEDDLGESVLQQFVNVHTCSGIKIKFAASDSSICFSECVSFSDSSISTSGTIIGWDWTFYGADPPGSTVQNPPLVCYPFPGIYPVKLKVFNTTTSDSLTKNFFITVFAPATLSTNINEVTITRGTRQQLLAFGDSLYSWTDDPPGSLDRYFVSNPIATPSDTTVYTVTGTDKNGCTSQKMVIINVVPPNIVWAPTAFAPNGDPRNKWFHLFTSGFINTLELKVFDRWGQLVFATKDPNEYWDGTFKGAKANTGVYVYYYKVTFTDGTEQKRSGDVTLLR